MEGEDASKTRQLSRKRVLTTKAAEQEKRRTTSAREWDDSEEEVTEDTIEAQMEVPKAPRPKRTQNRPATPSQTIKRGRPKEAGRKDDPLSTILAAIIELRSSNTELKTEMRDLKEEVVELRRQLEETRDQLAETNDQLATTKAQLSKTETRLADILLATNNISNLTNGVLTPPSGSPSQSYAAILARATTPTAPVHLAPTTATLYCTIDISRVNENEIETQPGTIRQTIEREMRTTREHEGWRCLAVNKDPRNSARVRIACRNETELQQVKEVAQRTVVAGARVLRDQLYPIKVDNANRTAILDHEGNLRPGVIEMLGNENDVKVAKVAWLSNRNRAKAYGSMVVYLTSGNDVTRLLQGQYFHVAGESAYTNVFEQRARPKQCYKCQELGHIAFSCQKAQVCAKCACEGHHHSNCQVGIPKCVLCGGPHESMSKNCRVLYPFRHD